MAVRSPLIELHSKQGEAFESDKKVTLCSAGIQSGKTTIGSIWLRKQISLWSSKKELTRNFIVGAPTYKILNQSTLPALRKIMTGKGEYLAGRQEFVCHDGSVIFIRTSTDPDSIEGITDVRAAWMDEAGKCKYRFWVNMEGRCARTDAPIMCTTTAYARNWPYTELIRPLERGERNDVLYLNWRSIDNPTFSKEHYDRQRQLLDPIRFAMKYDGVHAKRFGLVFDLPDHQIIDTPQIDKSWPVYAGVDWGFTDPLVIVLRAVTPKGHDIQFSEFYQSGVFPDEIPRIFKNLMDTWNVKQFVCDPSDPGKIAMLRKYRIPVLEADNDIRAGIDDHNMAIRSEKYFCSRDCPMTLDEYETYHWPEEEDEGLDAEDVPEDGNNHSMDANRYLTRYLTSLGIYQESKFRVSNAELKILPVMPSDRYIAPWEREKRKSKTYDEL